MEPLEENVLTVRNQVKKSIAFSHVARGNLVESLVMIRHIKWVAEAAYSQHRQPHGGPGGEDKEDTPICM